MNNIHAERLIEGGWIFMIIILFLFIVGSLALAFGPELFLLGIVAIGASGIISYVIGIIAEIHGGGFR